MHIGCAKAKGILLLLVALPLAQQLIENEAAIVAELKNVSWGARDQVIPSGEVQTLPPLSLCAG